MPLLSKTDKRTLPSVSSQVDRAVVKQLTIDYAYVLGGRIGNELGKLVDPPFDDALGKILYGRDYLALERPSAIYTMQSNRTIISGPYTCAEGFTCACELWEGASSGAARGFAARTAVHT